MTVSTRLHRALLLNTALLAAAVAGPAPAQDFQRIAPKELPPNPELQSLPAPALPAARRGGGDVLLPALKGVSFVPRADQIQPGGVTGDGIDTGRVDVLDEAAFRALVAPYLGQPLSLDRLNEIVSLTVVYFREHDHPLVDVIVPKQDITNGTVQILVMEFTAGTIRAEGNQWFSDDLLLAGIRTHRGDRIRASSLLDDVNALNQNPFRRVDLVYQRGERVGESDIVLRTIDRFPLRVYTGFENTGTPTSGTGRLMAGFNWGNVFGIGHMLNYQITGSSDALPWRSKPEAEGRPDEPRYLAHSGSYTAPLPWGDRVNLFGAYSRTVPTLADSLNMTGISWQVGARYTAPLPRMGDYRHELSLGADFKRTNNNLDFGGTRIYGNDIDIAQGVAEYTGRLSDGWGSTGFSLSVIASPGGVTPGNTRDAFTGGGGRDGSRPHYYYGRLGFDRQVTLPYGFGLSARGQAQIASAPLQSSEQMGIGGASTVRGYKERAANGDSGLLLSTEVLLPDIGIAGLLSGQAGIGQSLRPHIFFDTGRVANRTDVGGQARSVTLSSVGAGFRYALESYVSASFDYGVQLRPVSAGTPRDRMVHLALILGL